MTFCVYLLNLLGFGFGLGLGLELWLGLGFGLVLGLGLVLVLGLVFGLVLLSDELLCAHPLIAHRISTPSYQCSSTLLSMTKCT